MVEINLLPREYQQKAEPSVWKYASMAVAGLTAAVLGGWFLAVSGNTSRLQAESDGLQAQIDAVAPKKREFEALTARKTELEQVTNVALQLRDQKTYWSNDLAAFVDRVPQDIALSKIDMTTVAPEATANPAYAGKQVSREFVLNGKATSQAAIISFLNAYENDQNFGVDFRSMQREATTNLYNFTAAVGAVGDRSTVSEAAANAAAGTPAAGTTPTTGTTPAAGTTPTPAGTTAPAAPAPATPAPAASGGTR